ncbi:slipin family protein, partial [Streptomyces sp. SID11233]|nr:slipin family protein [Streptomyces sp. SID11233]
AARKLTSAASTMADTPGALQLRLLQTVVDVAAEKNSTLVMPFPVELLRFFQRGADKAGVPSSGGESVPLDAGPSREASSSRTERSRTRTARAVHAAPALDGSMADQQAAARTRAERRRLEREVWPEIPVR